MPTTRPAAPSRGRRSVKRDPMAQTFDTILKSGTVVNQDGEGVRDVGISNGRIAASSDRPIGICEYPTFIRIVGNTSRVTTPFRSRSRYISVSIPRLIPSRHPIRFRHRRIRCLPRLDARGRMQIEAGFQMTGMQAIEEALGIREKLLVPGVTRPAKEMS